MFNSRSRCRSTDLSFDRGFNRRVTSCEGIIISNEFTVGDGRTWSIDDVLSVIDDTCSVRLTEDRDRRRRLNRSAEMIREHTNDGRTVYGVNTGFGASQTRTIPSDRLNELPDNLVRYHGCGTGKPLAPEIALTTLLLRLITLARSHSGVRPTVLETMCDFLNHGLAPVIPEEGSVGASGDLTPLSYVAAVLQGDRSVWYDDEQHPTDEVLDRLDVEPVNLAPGEALALMNGTSMMTAVLCHAIDRARYLARLTCRVTALSVVALRGNTEHFHPRLFELKPHPGQARVARGIRRCLPEDPDTDVSRSQDRYSLRCAPHIIGVLADALDWIEDDVETEINGVDDNPVVDPEEEEILHGGNFYGGHVGFAADSLKNAVANLSDLMDRQLASLVDPRRNRGLPANLTGVGPEDRPLHHGFKALQIATSAWTAEALKLTMPSSVFSRSTESHNQDKVSMGSIGARDALRVLELTEQSVAAALMGGVQGLDLRQREDVLTVDNLPDPLVSTVEAVRNIVPFLAEDRPLDEDVNRLVAGIRSRAIPVEHAWEGEA